MRCLLLLALLTGCAVAEVRSSSQDAVIIRSHMRAAEEPQVLADAECAKYGKKARLNQSVPAMGPWNTQYFDCR